MRVATAEPRKKDGKDWMAQLRGGLKAMGCWSHGFDNIGQQTFGQGQSGPPRRTPKRPADRVVCWRGYLVLIEAKEVQQRALARSKFTRLEEVSLHHVTMSGGLAVVAVRHLNEGGEWDPWLCHYAHLMQAMRGAERKSLRVDVRPDWAVPLERGKVRDVKGLHLIMADGFAALRQTLHKVEPYHLDPDSELGPEKKPSRKIADLCQQAAAGR